MIEDDFSIKKKVEEVLDETGFTEQRAAKMGVDELLKYVRDSVIFLNSHRRYFVSQAAIGFPRCRHTFCLTQSLVFTRVYWNSKSSVPSSNQPRDAHGLSVNTRRVTWPFTDSLFYHST